MCCVNLPVFVNVAVAVVVFSLLLICGLLLCCYSSCCYYWYSCHDYRFGDLLLLLLYGVVVYAGALGCILELLLQFEGCVVSPFFNSKAGLCCFKF